MVVAGIQMPQMIRRPAGMTWKKRRQARQLVESRCRVRKSSFGLLQKDPATIQHLDAQPSHLGVFFHRRPTQPQGIFGQNGIGILQYRITTLGLLECEVVRLGKTQVFIAANPMNPRKVGRDKLFAVILRMVVHHKNLDQTGGRM